MRAAEYASFAAALCDAGAGLPDGIVAPDGTDLAERFAVYRNNVHVSLVEALAEGYPIVRAQVGEAFFHAMARAYVQAHKPAHASLTLYGGDFPAFIAGFEPAASLPWLHDLAALERAWLESWAAADAPSLPITALRTLAADDLAQTCVYIHPAARLVRSAWPVADLWEAHQSTPTDLSGIAWHAQDVLLTRPQAQVRLQHLDSRAADFTAALIAGDTIETAAMLVPAVDAGAVLAQLFDLGMIREIRS